MKDDDREPRLDLLRIAAVIVFVCMAVIVIVVALKPGLVVAPKEGEGELPHKIEPPPLPAPELAKKLEDAPATTPKAKLLKSELKKRAAETQQKKLAAATPPPTPGRTDVVLAGDSSLRRIFQRKLAGVSVVDGSERGFMLSLRVENGHGPDGIYSRCSAAVSELPARKLVAALSDRADVGGGGATEKDAVDACGDALAEDVSSWIRAHR